MMSSEEGNGLLDDNSFHHRATVMASTTSTSRGTEDPINKRSISLSKIHIVDRAINNADTFKTKLFVLCLALGNAADAVEILCVGFIMTELGDIPSFDKEFLSAAVFMGMLIGGLTCGLVSDRVGRKPCLLVSLALNAVAGLASAAAPSTAVLIFFRVLGGLGIGGSVPVVFSLGAELLPSNVRGKYLSIVASFWMVGAIFTAFVAWIMLGDNMYGNKISPNVGWRAFAAVCAFPAVLALCCSFQFLPESPRFLLQKKEYVRTAAALTYITGVEYTAESLQISCVAPTAAAAAAGQSSSSIWKFAGNAAEKGTINPIFSHHQDDTVDSETKKGDIAQQRDLEESPTKQSNKSLQFNQEKDHSPHFTSPRIHSKAEAFLYPLFAPAFRLVTITLILIWFTLSFGSYGLATWISTLFLDVGITNEFSASFIFAMANLPGNVVSILFVETYGRKKLLAYGMVLAGISAIGFAVDTRDAGVVVTCAALFNAFSVIGWNSLDCLSVELFPTSARTTAMGVLAASGRLGAICAQFVNGSLESNVPLLLFVTSACTILGGAITLFLPPDRTGTALPGEEDSYCGSEEEGVEEEEEEVYENKRGDPAAAAAEGQSSGEVVKEK